MIFIPKAFYKNIELEISSGVYEPREDSFLLAKVLEKELSAKKFKRVLEIGCGSGLLAIIAAKKGRETTAADIDDKALECAKKNASANSVKINFVLSDLFEEISGKFDLIIFNPPYLPEEISDFSRTWAAGKNLEMIFHFLSGAKNFLAPNGALLLVCSSLSNPEKIIGNLKQNGFSSSIAYEQKIPFETLYAIRAEKQIYK